MRLNSINTNNQKMEKLFLLITLLLSLIVSCISKNQDKSFEETMKPVWSRVRQMGLAEEDISALIEEARAKSSS